MTLQIELTGNEARLIFFSIKNKKSPVAENIRQKLIVASDKSFMKRQHKELNLQGSLQNGNSDRPQES